jgi:hypothetical protein
VKNPEVLAYLTGIAVGLLAPYVGRISAWFGFWLHDKVYAFLCVVLDRKDPDELDVAVDAYMTDPDYWQDLERQVNQ